MTVAIFISIVFAENALSFSGATHRILSNHGVLNSVLKKDNYLVNYLGFQDGLGEIFKWQDKKQSVIEWVQDGSDLEDGTMWDYLILKGRSFNHFHNPLKEWGAAGLNDIFTGESALLWAQNSGKQQTFPQGDWSWQKTRLLYYTTLTATTEEARQQYFAMMFRGLGHQMHLIQDMGVPEHARNDAHPEQTLQINQYDELFFEPWAVKAEEKGAVISQYAQNPLPATVSLNKAINDYVPITQFTDTDQYTGSNPSISTDIGLSEYTNANFFSDDTIFAAERYSSGDRHYFPYPKESDTDVQDYINQGKLPEIILAWDGVEDLGFWIAKKAGNEIEIEHFLKPTYHTLNLPIHIPIYYRTFYRDEVCHADYASKLVPRAVGYSAGLLDYFFRGKLQVTSVPLIAGVVEGSDIYQNSLYGIMLKVKNISTSQEDMKDGFFVLTCRYTPPGGSPDGSDDIFIQTWAASYDTHMIPCEELKYEEEMILYFYIPLLTLSIEDLGSVKCSLAFSGTLGNEQGAVIGKSFTLGEIKFNEEWNNGLNGNHPWQHTTPDQNPNNGSTANTVENGFLIKDNIRYQGHDTARFNESYIEFAEPILITPTTYLNFKIDVMSINEQPPAPPDTTNAWQMLLLRFNNDRWVEFTQPGQGVTLNSTSAYYSFTLGLPIVHNIYDMFLAYNITIPEPLYLTGISFWQQLWTLDDPSTIEHHQHIEADFVRIIEGKEE